MTTSSLNFKVKTSHSDIKVLKKSRQRPLELVHSEFIKSIAQKKAKAKEVGGEILSGDRVYFQSFLRKGLQIVGTRRGRGIPGNIICFPRSDRRDWYMWLKDSKLMPFSLQRCRL